MSLNSQLVCACAAAYSISTTTGHYKPDSFYEPKVGYAKTPVGVAAPSMPGGPKINACLVGATSKEVIVAFRGTLFGETTASLEDWLQNFLMEPKAEPGLPGEVHRGFYEAVKSISSQVIAHVRTLRGSSNLPVYVTGHSKGGAMAPIFAYLLHDAGIDPAGVVTFAAPMSGDAVFAAKYNSVITNHTRFENFGDLVPMLPPTTAFINAFVSVVSQYKQYIPTWLYNMIVSAQDWNYTAVGSEQYIVPNVFEGGYIILPNIGTDVIAGDIVLNIVSYDFDIEQALLSAHTIQCGYGYFSSMCPTITSCPSTSEDAAALPQVAPPKHKPDISAHRK